MPQLHYHPSNASMAPHLVLEELAVPFELVLVDRANHAHKSPAYLALNPNGLIPVWVDGDLVLYETAATACTSPTPIRRRTSPRRSAPRPGPISTSG